MNFASSVRTLSIDSVQPLRTGNLASSARTISIAYYSSSFQETLWKYHGLIIVNRTFNSTV
jgi:hypothetical protein